MSTFSWTFDAVTGVYKNHALSSDLRSAAIAQTLIMQFVSPEAGYGKKVGESITIVRISNIAEPSTGIISEQERIPEDNLTMTSTAITVAEWGRSVPYTNLAEQLGKFDPESMVQKKLMQQMQLTLDTGAAGGFKQAQIVAEPTGVASINFDTGGVATQQATAGLNVYHIEQIRDYMFGTLHIPYYEGDSYIGLVATKSKRSLMADPAFETWHKYTDPQAKYNSEIGRLEQIRFVEINHFNALSNSLGAGGVLGEGLFFGEDAVAMAVAEDPELRRAIPEDYGRKQGVAWYGILNFGIVWNTSNPGEARVVHLSST